MATMKQKAVVKDLLENTGKPVSKAMSDAGYPYATAKNPQQLTNSKGFNEYLDELMPESKVAEIQARLIGANDLQEKLYPLTMSAEEIKSLTEAIRGSELKLIKDFGGFRHAFYTTDDRLTQKSGVEMYHKVRGNFAPEKVIDNESQRKLDEIRQELKDFIGAK